MGPKPAHLFPPSNAPRTWLITSAASPIGLRLSRALLDHGDNAVLCLSSVEHALYDDLLASDPHAPRNPSAARVSAFSKFLNEEAISNGKRDRTRVVVLDGRIGQCQAAVAQALESFGGLDILLCCASEAVVGTVEELAKSPQTLTLVREQFETNFFGPINIMKAVLPAMRERRSGHIITLTGITGHLGTPGLGAFCASGWAIEGFCDSLAYEIAPFNIKLTIVQPNYEIPVLTNKISAAPSMAQYAPPAHPAPLSRAMLGRLLDRIGGVEAGTPEKQRESSGTNARSSGGGSGSVSSKTEDGSSGDSSEAHVSLADPEESTSVIPNLPTQMLDALVAETVHALIAIGGHENPPARHIVGFEGIASVKEKLKTVSEELEDFVDCSGAVDIDEHER